MPFTGGCLCGRLRYEINRRHLNAMHCHCAMCRKAHGTAFSTHVVVRPDQFQWRRRDAEPQAYESSPDAYREFCPRCGTHLLVHGQSGDDTLAIPAGTLDGDPDVTILGHMYVRERVSWCTLEDDLPRYDEWPPGFGPAATEGREPPHDPH